ncbi:site-specific integrase [Ferrimicrobium sp.]|uniref:tyrosine-type recombinase/integrase n=1 Tax=Ferrimicrobium sp. TaxID=2926050 RepID=UPI0026186277|nr:site-specific integrase [Ferrimicrobium sp.]
MARRTFGYVRKLPSGRWQASYLHDGKRFTGERTYTAKADADAWLANVHTEILRGEWVNPDRASTLLHVYATRWLDSRSDLRPTTKAKYAGLMRLHILPTFGHLRLGAISPDRVRGWYYGFDSPSLADDGYRLLRAIFATAVSDGWLARSPCKIKGAGSVKAPERPTASIPEVLAAAEAMPERLRLAVLLAAFAQLRRGEVLGLTRGDIDLMRGVVYVRRALVQPSGARAEIGPPKTDAGIRSLSVPAFVVEALRGHLEAFVGPQTEGWLFGAGDRPVSPRTLDRAWNNARASINRPDLHFHDLRHSGLTWAAATGASVADLMRRGGHASTVAALRYQHSTEDRDRALSEALGGLASPVADLDIARRSHDEALLGLKNRG